MQFFSQTIKSCVIHPLTLWRYVVDIIITLSIIAGSESRLRGSQEFLDIQEGEDEEEDEGNDDFHPLPCFGMSRDRDMDKVGQSKPGQFE